MSDGSKIKGKILLTGQIECLSPLHIGSGGDRRSDLDILLDSDGNPFIPATTFVGILRHAFKKYNQFSDDFWGYTKGKDGRQSAFCCSDLTHVSPASAQIIVRDGIQIDTEKGLVKPHGKFDFELVERGNRFNFNIELTYREQDEMYVKRTARTIYDLLAKQHIHIGAKTNSGLGQIRLCEEDTKVYDFNFSKKPDVLHWLTKDLSQENIIQVEALGEPFDLCEKHFSIKAEFEFKNSLIIRSYSHQPEMPDTTQISSKDDWVIPGASLKGAIRARAERIVNTLDLKKEIITDLFGNVEAERHSKNAKKGKIRIQEVYLAEKDFPSELQARIKVDRFTGGVIEGGLFDSMPIFAYSGGGLVNLQIDVFDCSPCEIGLLLLVLKDLWSGDLAVGGEKNIGRGVFQGVKAEISWDNEKVILEKNVSKLSLNEKNRLQEFVNVLVKGEIE